MKTKDSASSEKAQSYSHIELSAEVFDDIKAIVAGETGLDLGSYKDKCIKRRIAVRIRAKRCCHAEEYVETLLKDEVERKKLLETLTINVTQFFRNFATFEKIMEEVLPCIYGEKEKNDEMHIWSVGCSSGEEPYSIAIILRDYFPKQLRKFPARIIATDVDRTIIKKAIEGIYEEKSLEEMPSYLKEKYFEIDEGGKHRIVSQIKQMVDFKQKNILTDKPYMNQDLIVCRNILIYFSREQQAQILLGLAEALREGGFLVLGKAESLVASSRKEFSVINARERIYRKLKTT